MLRGVILKYLDKYLESRGYTNLYSGDSNFMSPKDFGIYGNHHNRVYTYAVWDGKNFVKPSSAYYSFFKEVFESMFNESYIKHKCSVQNRFERLMTCINHKYSNRSDNLITIFYDGLKIDNICEPDRMIIVNNRMKHIIHFKKDIHSFHYDKENLNYVLEYSKSTLDEAFVDMLIYFKSELSQQFGDLSNRQHALSTLTLIDIIDY